jgi:hypothetical protein
MQMNKTRAFVTLGFTAAMLALAILPALGATAQGGPQHNSKLLVAGYKASGQQTVAENVQRPGAASDTACVYEFKDKVAKGDLPKDADQDGYVKYCMSAPAEPTQRPAVASGTTPIKIEMILPGGGSKDVTDAADGSEDAGDVVGDVVVTWGDGRREQLTRGVHAQQAKLGPDGLIGWTWGTERYRNSWINEHLRVQRGKRLLFEVKPAMSFIENWAFAPEGLIVKSRMAHGAARIELFSLSTGKRIQLIEKAYEDDGDNLPTWAKPFAD